MRLALCLSTLLLFTVSMNAQRMSGNVASGRTSTRATGFSGFIPITNTPNVRTSTRFPNRPFFDGFNHFGFRNSFVLPPGFFPNGFRHNRGFNFGFGNTPFFGGFGWGWGGYYPYVDYSNWYYEQNLPQYQAEVDQNDRLREEMQADQRRQMQLDQQLADQRAADAVAARSAPPAMASNITPNTTPTDREVPPTVLVYRDHHQVELRNYAITPTMVYDFGPHWTRKIQLSDLDIPATINANQERGIAFRVPSSSTPRQ